MPPRRKRGPESGHHVHVRILPGRVIPLGIAEHMLVHVFKILLLLHGGKPLPDGHVQGAAHLLHHFQGKIEIGTGNGGIISQLKMQNEMKLTDESWISYQQGKGNEEYQKYMEDLTDMQNHVLPYLQSFCSLEEKGVKERREQQVAEKNESREAVPRTGGEANIAVKDAGKAERKEITGKEKKPSIHERLEINKRIIQEKQGKDEPERGADLSVRMV